VLVDGYVYGSNWVNNNKGNWCCINFETGEKKYEETFKNKGSIIFADGMLYIYSEQPGFVGLVKPSPEKFELVSSFQITKGNGPHWAHPSIYDGKLFIRHGDYLLVYDIKEK
jgi:outer membrane protein assembly factor BamB